MVSNLSNPRRTRGLTLLDTYVKLARVGPAFAPYPLGFLLGVACANAWAPKMILAVFSLFLSSCGGHAMNYVADVEVDALATKVKEKPPWFNPILTGEVSRKKAYLFSIVTVVMSLALAWFVGQIFFLASIAGIIGGIICYSMFYFKAKPYLDMLLPLTTGFPLFLAGYYLMVPQLPFPFFHIAVMIPLSIVYFLDTVIHDIEFDRKAGLRTTAVFLGQKRSIQATSILTACTFLLSMLALVVLRNPFFLLTGLACFTRLFNHLMRRLYAFMTLALGFIIISFLAYLLVFSLAF